MNFPRGISASFAQFGSCFPVDRADKLIAKIYPAASMDVTPIALEVCGTCSQLPWESTLRPPSRRSMWSLRRPPQQHAVDRPEHAQLASNLCEKSAASRTLESFGIDYRGSAKRT
jgi:hypothetical protein